MEISGWNLARENTNKFFHESVDAPIGNVPKTCYLFSATPQIALQCYKLVSQKTDSKLKETAGRKADCRVAILGQGKGKAASTNWRQSPRESSQSELFQTSCLQFGAFSPFGKSS